jgi:hypothetical protein
MSQRDISALNNQIVLNSGSILDPSNLKAISTNSLKVRNDLLNISEYINGLLYYMFKALPSGVNYAENAAESGLSGNTILANPNSISSFGDVFWLASGEELGRPKTITESLETLEAKLIQQQVNISLVQRVDLTALAATVNNASTLVYKLKRDVFGSNYDSGTTDLNYTIKEYLYRLYATIFPTLDVQELNPGESDFPELAFSTSVSQTDIPGCGEFISLNHELLAIKNIISGLNCDPSFELEFDENIFGPSNSGTTIEQSLQLLRDKAIDLGSEVLQNATDISNIETQLSQLAGVQAATEAAAGTVKIATQAEIRNATGSSDNSPLVMTPESFVNSITDYFNASVMYTDSGNEINNALKMYIGAYLSYSSVTRLRNTYQGYSHLTRTTSATNSFTSTFKRNHVINTENGDVTMNITSKNGVVIGDLISFVNETDGGRIIISVDPGVGTIEGQQTLILDQPYAAVTLMMNGTRDKLLVVSKYNA